MKKSARPITWFSEDGTGLSRRYVRSTSSPTTPSIPVINITTIINITIDRCKWALVSICQIGPRSIDDFFFLTQDLHSQSCRSIRCFRSWALYLFPARESFGFRTSSSRTRSETDWESPYWRSIFSQPT